MSRLLLTLLAGVFLAVPHAQAQKDTPAEDEHAGHHPAAAQASGQPSHDPAEHLRANMKTMQDVMARIRDTADPAEKKRLLRVHMLAMQEQIRTMRAPAPDAHDHGGEAQGKGGEAKKDGGMGMMKGEMMGGGMMKMHKKVDQRLDALEGLIEQLIEHEAAEDALETR
jgi:Ni/Co efflux regulator RcnB